MDDGEPIIECQNAIVCGGEAIHNRDMQDLCLTCRIDTMDGNYGGILDPTKKGIRHYVYVLKSEACGGWYYVGVTNSIGRRLFEHASDRGSLCTQRWRYTTLVALYKYPFSSGRESFETKMTYRWMNLLGRDWFRVRGGPHCDIDIPRNQRAKKPAGLLHAIQSDPFIGALCDCGYPPVFETRGASKGARFLKCPVPTWYSMNTDEYNVERGCDYRVAFDRCEEIH